MPPKLRAIFKRIGYFADPVMCDLDGHAAQQRDVLLSKRGSTSEYYRQVAKNSTAGVKSGSWSASDVATSVASLPLEDRSQVSAALKDTGAINIVAEVEQAGKVARIGADIQAKLTSRKDFSDIHVHSNYPAIGSVLMIGEVGDAKTSRSASDIAITAKGSAKLANEIRVIPHVANVEH